MGRVEFVLLCQAVCIKINKLVCCSSKVAMVKVGASRVEEAIAISRKLFCTSCGRLARLDFFQGSNWVNKAVLVNKLADR